MKRRRGRIKLFSPGAGARSSRERGAERANPTGGSASAEKRYALRRWASRAALPLMLLLSLTAAYAVARWSIGSQDQHLRDSLQSTGANALLAAQQLDAVFTEIVKRIPPDRAVSEPDRIFLNTWLRYDEKFLAQNGDRPDVRFERALVHRRIGQVMLLLQDTDRAQEELDRAIELLNELSREQPTVTSLVSEITDTHVRLGWAKRQSGDLEGAMEEYRVAGNLLTDERLARDPTYEPDPNLDPHVINTYVLDCRAELALQRGASAEAVKYREQMVEIMRRLSAEYPGVASYRSGLKAAEKQLESLRQPALSP